ncbi:MAG: hypothetical protein KDK99_10685 [Verrucomicrobiales bacterium]|nr:hypothetical protein [Verrucomicrobiales bacterium]
MSVTFAITGIITLFLSFWALNVSRDPKEWRLWWLDLLAVLDVETPREMRRVQERQMAAIGFLLFVLFVATTVSCVFWTVDSIRDTHRDKTRMELEIERTKRQIDQYSH